MTSLRPGLVSGTMLEGLSEINWSAIPQPERNKPNEIADAIRDLSRVSTELSEAQRRTAFYTQLGITTRGRITP